MADGRVSFSVEAVVRGYHAYKDILAAVYGEELPCEREASNWVDAFAVAVMKDGMVVGHISKIFFRMWPSTGEIFSTVCSLYLRRGGSIICRVTGSRRYSEDLIQGGLKIPCVLIFEGGLRCSVLHLACLPRAQGKKWVKALSLMPHWQLLSSLGSQRTKDVSWERVGGRLMV